MPPWYPAPNEIGKSARAVWRDPCGATLIEIIAVLLILGIITTVLISHVSDVSQYESLVSTDTLKEDIRYAQLAAMQNASIFGIENSGGHYWMFSGTNPDISTHRRYFPGAGATTVNISGTGDFTYFFDSYGRPYTAYRSTTNNAPLITNQSIAVGGKTLRIYPETGYVQ